MPRTRLPKPTPAELGLLRTLWQLGPASVRQVHEAQRRERPDLGYANVLRLMQVMHGKGLLKRDESQRSHDDLIHKAFAGSGKDLVLAALRGGRVSDAEREEIQRFLEDTRDD